MCLRSYIYVVIMFFRINKNSLASSYDLKKVEVWMPFNTWPDKCAGWRQVEASVVLGRQVTVVELTPSINTNTSQCGILTQIQIQGDDGKKSLARWGRRCWGLASLWRQTVWYVPCPPAFGIAFLLIPTYVWTGNQPVQAFIDCRADGKTWALLFDSRHGHHMNIWFNINQLTLNLNRTQYMEFRIKNYYNVNIQIKYDQKVITNTTEIKFLGLIINDTLSWK